MARPKSASHDLKRDAILDLAARCFAQHSYHAASMNDIAEAGGTSKARLYHYYESKEAILFDLLDRYTQRLLAIVGETEAAAQRRVAFLERLLEAKPTSQHTARPGDPVLCRYRVLSNRRPYWMVR